MSSGFEVKRKETPIAFKALTILFKFPPPHRPASSDLYGGMPGARSCSPFSDRTAARTRPGLFADASAGVAVRIFLRLAVGSGLRICGADPAFGLLRNAADVSFGGGYGV